MTATIDGRAVRYKVSGDNTAFPIVLTPAGFFSLERIETFANRFAAKGWRTVVWDRPGSGGSDFDFGAPDLLRCWSDTLAQLLQYLKIEKAVVAGVSGGQLTSIAFAHYHPDFVTALACLLPHTDNPAINRRVQDQTFFEPIRQVRELGLHALASQQRGFFKFAEQIATYAHKKDVLLNMDPEVFCRTMTRWADMMSVPKRGFLANLSDVQLSRIAVPTLVVPPLVPDEVHPYHTALLLSQALPNATLIDWEAELGDQYAVIKRDPTMTGPGPQKLLPMVKTLDSYVRPLIAQS